MITVRPDLPAYDHRAAEICAEKKGAGANTAERKGSLVNPDVLTGDLYDDRYNSTQRGLKSRHCQMIALGGTIGTGLFVGTGQTLAIGGPAFLFGAFCWMTFLVWCVVTGITEVSSWCPTKGCSMNLFGYRYVSRSLGFAMGWLYWYSLGILVPYEITAAALVIEYWEPPVNIAVWITVMIVVIVGLNLLPVKFYGETEFWFAGTKIIMMIGLIFVSIILFFGGGPTNDRLGFRYWQRPRAANVFLVTSNEDTGRFLALLRTWVLSAFPFAFAPELLVATGGEVDSPRRNLPIAGRRYFFRLVFFYVTGVLCISVICPSDDARLTSGGAGAGSSPFVVGIANAGIPVLDSIINAGIIVSAWSSGNSFMYLSSRSLYALALSGNAPSVFKYCGKNGVPYAAIGLTALYVPLSYLNVSSGAAVVFNWFVNLTNQSAFISWICCAITYLRFRKACEAQGIKDADKPYHSWMQPWGSYVSIAGFAVLALINGFDTFFPSRWSVSRFFTAYVGLPLFFAFYFGHRIWSYFDAKDPWAHPPEEVDLVTGLEDIIAEETPRPKYKHKWEYVKLIWE
ncbi:histidine permease [Elsinoe ampelina]|uniref:Histidine permease n=1 Tax=Elsinoe ampelina TaxID=302913 RepID=A0A6A6GEI7_9PEZI|nr:histidine permease [Elsinoe ampelina]